jgi:CHAT domain-containing protein
VSEIRSDVFIVNPTDIRFVPLPLLDIADLESYSNMFLNAIRRHSPRDHAEARGEMHNVLVWLWDVAISPILDELGLTEACQSNSVLSRVWWVGSGLLNILPLHAAGYHESGSTRNALDRVISSYTPTMKALAYARERNNRVPSVNFQKVMLVGWPERPGQDNLPFVASDIKELNNLLSPRIRTTVVQTPSRENVLSALLEHQIVHFSCHGYSSATNPSESRLLLNDWKNSPLTVSDLTACNIQLGRFAFLSACHPASSRDFRLLSESINLSSAIQLAGYPSVVGTLWQVTAKHSAEIARDVYGRMLVGNELDTERSAESLNWAVRTLRDRTRVRPGFSKIVPDDPLIWAPFIHLGV